MIASLWPRSAIVRATFSTRWVLRADQPAARRACRKRDAAAQPRLPVDPRPEPPGSALASEGVARAATTRARIARSASPAALPQLLRHDRRHFDVQVDAIEQRAAELALVARHLVGRAAAGPAPEPR